DAVGCAVAADRNDRALVAQHHLCDARRHHADAVLARIVAFDDGDVGVADILLDGLPRRLAGKAALLENLRRGHAGDARARPDEDLGRAVLAQHLRLDRYRIDAKLLRQVNAEPQAVEICPGAQHAIVAGELAGEVGQRIGWVGDDEDYRLGRGGDDLR